MNKVILGLMLSLIMTLALFSVNQNQILEQDSLYTPCTAKLCTIFGSNAKKKQLIKKRLANINQKGALMILLFAADYILLLYIYRTFIIKNIIYYFKSL